VLALPVGTTVWFAGVSVAPGLGLGMAAVYAAILVDFYIQAAVNTARFRSGKWQIVARRSEASGTLGDD
jgi:Na+-driven multidrug efflux pump